MLSKQQVLKNLQNLENEGKFTENVYSQHDKEKLNFFTKVQIMIGKKILVKN